METSRTERRAFIRIEYPTAERPRFLVEDHEMEVINLSERGLKILDDKQILGKTGKTIKGKLQFTNGKAVNLLGQIVWTQGNEIGIIINGRIAFPLMEEQQVFVQKG